MTEQTSRAVVGPLDQPVGLTEQERHTLTLTADCWNSWCSLPARDAADNDEFMRAIHAAQHLIALRVARRADPDVWRQPNPKASG
jgi:hypothetical protein